MWYNKYRKEREVNEMNKNKFWELVGYITLAGLIIGQITIGFDFWIGQIAYFITDVIIMIRGFIINQPTSDKVKNVAMTAICLGVCIVKFFSKTP